jgi:hypothetical protein
MEQCRSLALWLQAMTIPIPATLPRCSQTIFFQRRLLMLLDCNGVCSNKPYTRYYARSPQWLEFNEEYVNELLTLGKSEAWCIRFVPPFPNLPSYMTLPPACTFAAIAISNILIALPFKKRVWLTQKECSSSNNTTPKEPKCTVMRYHSPTFQKHQKHQKHQKRS